MEEGINTTPNTISLLDRLKQEFDGKEVDIRSINPLNLAFVGDNVFDLMIRTLLVRGGSRPTHELHKKKSQLVKAATQARLGEVLEEALTPDELAVYKRGRNAKSATSAKNASVTDYRKATGLEALMGYLYLTGQEERMVELFREGLSRLGREI